MKIRDAQEMYRAQIRDYNSEISAVSMRRKEIQNALKNASGADKQNEYYDYVNDLTEQWCMWANAESAKQQGETMKDYYRDMAKVMEVARRLMKGDIVPSTDEKKLMEYNDKLYQMAKNMGEMAKVEKTRNGTTNKECR